MAFAFCQLLPDVLHSGPYMLASGLRVHSCVRVRVRPGMCVYGWGVVHVCVCMSPGGRPGPVIVCDPPQPPPPPGFER